jgi:hypothetical protein
MPHLGRILRLHPSRRDAVVMLRSAATEIAVRFGDPGGVPNLAKESEPIAFQAFAIGRPNRPVTGGRRWARQFQEPVFVSNHSTEGVNT